MSDTSRQQHVLPGAVSVLAVVAHPDDESFGLGAILAGFVDAGSDVSVLCFTRGEASTLGADNAELGRVRGAELEAAARELGVARVELLDYLDGALADVALAELAERVFENGSRAKTDLVLVLDEGGITGHPDHRRATEAALVAARELGAPVLAWALSGRVADALTAEFGAEFVGRGAEELDFAVPVDRGRQRRAIDCHASQATDNRVLWRRLQLQGDQEALRWLSTPPR